MELRSNYSIKSSPSFGMAIGVHPKVLERMTEYAPDFIELIGENAEKINKLTPNNDVVGLIAQKLNLFILIKPKNFNGIKGLIESSALIAKAIFAETSELRKLMPQNAEILRLPSTANALINALTKITK